MKAAVQEMAAHSYVNEVVLLWRLWRSTADCEFEFESAASIVVEPRRQSSPGRHWRQI